MYYQKASKNINSDYYNTYTGHVKRSRRRKRGETNRGDILTTIIKVLAIIFLLTLIIFGYVFVSNQYYLAHSSSKPIESSEEFPNKVIGIDTIESSVATIIKKEEEQLSSEDVGKIVQMVMLKMNTLNEQEIATSNRVSSIDTKDTLSITIDKKDKTKKVIINQETLESKNVKFIVVKKGDTLSTIAGRVYGDKTAYKKIRHANGEAIKDSNKIIAGQRLRIPL